MEKLKSLSPTKAKEIDTSMAKKYINKINGDGKWPEDDLYHIEVEPGNIVKVKETNDIFDALYYAHFKDDKSRTTECYWKSLSVIIAEKLEENTEMFVQLEYLLRGTDPRDVREGHIKLMSQLAQCCYSMWNIMPYYATMIFTESTPLYNLAFVFWALFYEEPTKCNNFPMIMINNKKLKPLCEFFVNICRDAGLKVALVYTSRALNIEHLEKEFLWVNNGIFKEPADNVGCTGVVAERADLDSAIDCFINSSVTAPWRFKQIYVQESIFEDFVDALRAKASGSGGDAVCVGDKTFLLEAVGGNGLGLPTSAFRSTREVLSLINTPYLSLWAAETALSNEIALQSPSSTVWINDYASFYGDPRSALSVFKIHAIVSLPCPDIKDILSKWSNLKTKERFDVIYKAFTTCDFGCMKSCLPDLKQYSGNSSLEITDKTICFGIQKHFGLIAERMFFGSGRSNALRTLVNGNGIYCYGSDCETMEQLQKFGIPIATLGRFSNINLPYPMLVERLKVVRTNYGTIYAN